MSMTLEQLRKQLGNCIEQRDQYASAFQQAIGAINLLQEQIKMLMLEEALAKKKAEEDAANLAAETAKAAAEAEAEKQIKLVDMAAAKLDMDCQLDQGVLQDGNTNG